MIIRMIEYDFAIALEQTMAGGRPYEMHFPQSCILYLRHTAKTPDALELKVHLPDGGSFLYRTPVIKVQTYTRDAIFQKKLLFFLPYYIMRYENRLAGKEIDLQSLEPLLQEFDDIRCKLEAELYDNGKSILYKDLIKLIIAISDYIVKSEQARERMEKTMGGKVLELESERQARLLKEHEQRMQEQQQRFQEQLQEQQHGFQEQLEQSLQALITTLQDYCNSPEEIYEKVRKNKPFENVTFEDIKRMM